MSDWVPVKRHTQPLDIDQPIMFAGIKTCELLMRARQVSWMGIVIAKHHEISSLFNGFFADDVLDAFINQGAAQINDMSLTILNEQDTVFENGPILIIGLDPTSLQIFMQASMITDVIYMANNQENLNSYLSAYPDSAAIEIHSRAAQVEFTEKHEKAHEWFDGNYDVIAHNVITPNTKPILLGKDDPLICRYCDKGTPLVTFRKKAHAFPEQVGNKALVDKLECDTCNDHFSKFVEDDFGKWTLPIRATGRVNGKGIPAIKSGDAAVKISAKNSKELIMVMREDDSRYILDDNKNRFSLSLERQPYTPMGVFKCLVKMALAVMPSEELALCEHLKKWILNPNHTFESYPYTPLNILVQMIPGPLPNNRIEYCLLKRKPSANCPYMVFALQFSNVVYQIILPMHQEDKTLLESGSFEFCYFPYHAGATKEHEDTYGFSSSKTIDMSGTQLVKGEHELMNFQYDKLVETNNPVS